MKGWKCFTVRTKWNETIMALIKDLKSVETSQKNRIILIIWSDYEAEQSSEKC